MTQHNQNETDLALALYQLIGHTLTANENLRVTLSDNAGATTPEQVEAALLSVLRTLYENTMAYEKLLSGIGPLVDRVCKL